jgi:hypothetical protein
MVLPVDITPGQPGHAAIHNATNAEVNTISVLKADASALATLVSKGELGVSVKDAPYSATGNGSTDDSTAFNTYWAK